MAARAAAETSVVNARAKSPANGGVSADVARAAVEAKSKAKGASPDDASSDDGFAAVEASTKARSEVTADDGFAQAISTPQTADDGFAVEPRSTALGNAQKAALEARNTPALSDTTLSRGMTSADVTTLQGKLAAQGIETGPIDGIFGPRTQAAVRAYQSANGLKVDGIVGPNTRAGLNAGATKSATNNATNSATTPGVNGGLAGLLDEISEGEGTTDAQARARGFASGYDVTLGYGAYTPASMRDKPLSEMTLGEVKQLQRGMLQNPRNHWNSSAVGKYQIVGTTLRGLQRSMNLPDSAVFSPALQDRMAAQLLEQRGLSRFQSGRLSASRFQNSIAREWASVATTRGGSYYGGQGVGTTRSEIQSALSRLL